MIEIPITSATVPSPLDCVISNADWQALVSLLQAFFPDDAAIWNFGNTEPAPSRRVYPWYRSNSDGSPDKVYSYSMGAWISLHPMAPGSVIMYEGTEASIDTFDGGEAGAVTAISGPMWEKVTSMNAKFPIGPGTLPSTTILGVGDTGGEEKHSLTIAEMPPHSHVIRADQKLDLGGDVRRPRPAGTAGTDSDISTEETGGSGSPAVVTAHNNLPPYQAIFFLRKTARRYYRL